MHGETMKNSRTYLITEKAMFNGLYERK